MQETLYGRQEVLEALKSHRRSFEYLTLSSTVHTEAGIITAIIQEAKKLHVPIRSSEKYQMDRKVGHDNHQGVMLLTSEYPYVSLSEIISPITENSLFLVLDLLQDPQNVGSLLRTAEAVGVQGVIIPEKKAVGILPSVANASSGAVEHLQIAPVVNLSQAIETLKENHVWVYGLGDKHSPMQFNDPSLIGPLALVVGSEGWGLRELVARHCDGLLRLPMRGHIGSLNAATAGSIALYRLWELRQFS